MTKDHEPTPPYRNLSPGAIGIRLPWEECVPLAAAAGFEGIDLEVDPAIPAERYLEALGRHGLRAGGMGLPVDFRKNEETFRKGLDGLEPKARLAAEIGLTRFFTWIIPWSDTMSYRENFKQHAERLGQVARILAAHGCRLGLEWVGPKTSREGHRHSFAHTLEQMLELAEAVGPNAGLLVDSWHVHTSTGTLDDLLGLSAEQVVYAHINDAPRGIGIEQVEDCVRCIPGETGVQDLAGFLHALRKIGYDGPVTPEPFYAPLNDMEPTAAATRVGEALRKVWSLSLRPPMPQTMHAMALGGGKAWLAELPVPRPRGHEVVVKVHAASLCGSDLGAFHREGECVNPGHEGAGEVVAVAQSSLLRVGDRVALAPAYSACGRCAHCRAGDVIFCPHQTWGGGRGHSAQFTLVADVACAKIPDDIDYVQGALMGCALGPAYEALKRLDLRAFDTIVIAGLGPVGLGATALASFLGARVVALDPEPWRRDHALKLGAAHTLDPLQPNIADAILELTSGQRIAKSLDCSGKESSERLLIDLAVPRGTVAFVGENQGTIPLSPSQDMIRKGLTLIGCWHMNLHDAPDLVEFLRRAPEKADLLVSHRFGFGEIQKALEVFAGRQTSKVMLLPWE